MGCNCSKSKRAVATTESLSTRKKLQSNSSKKVQNLEVSYNAKVLTNNDKDDNTNIIPYITSNGVEKKDVGTNLMKSKSILRNSSMKNDAKIYSTLELREQEVKQKGKDVQIEESIMVQNEIKQDNYEEVYKKNQGEEISTIELNHEEKDDHESTKEEEKIIKENEEDKQDNIVVEECNTPRQHKEGVSNTKEEDNQEKIVQGDHEINKSEEEITNDGNAENMQEEAAADANEEATAETTNEEATENTNGEADEVQVETNEEETQPNVETEE